MKTLVLAVAIFLIVPALPAQQAETKETPPQRVPQESLGNPNLQNNLPEAIRLGHPLDPADVDILTGKRDREIEAFRRANSVIYGGVYGGYTAYGDVYALNGRGFDGRRSATFDVPLLPLRRIANPFFFFNMPPGRFGSRGFGRR